MALDFEIKTSVDEETHDNALVVARAYDFKTRAEWVRFLIERELSWATPQVHINRIPGVLKGRD
jgi:hypothetical protein